MGRRSSGCLKINQPRTWLKIWVRGLFAKNKKSTKMGLRKGQTNNPGGRKPGTPNKITGETKAWIQNVVDGNRKKFEADLKKLEAKDRLVILERLISYLVPKQQAISIEAEIKSEYEALEKLLINAPESAIEQIEKRIENLQQHGTK
jgi:hypothetical protein